MPVEVTPEPEFLGPLRRGEPIPAGLRFGDGTPNQYAIMAEQRRRADVYYLQTFAVTGDHEVAAGLTCELFDHDARASRCLRCGRGVRAVGRRG